MLLDHRHDHRLIVLIGDLDPDVGGAGEGGVDLVRAPGRAGTQHMDSAEQIDGGVRVPDHPQRRAGALGAGDGRGGRSGRGLFSVGGAGRGGEGGGGGQGGQQSGGEARDTVGRLAHAVCEGHCKVLGF